jgi:hypothetical protein
MPNWAYSPYFYAKVTNWFFYNNMTLFFFWFGCKKHKVINENILFFLRIQYT